MKDGRIRAIWRVGTMLLVVAAVAVAGNLPSAWAQSSGEEAGDVRVELAAHVSGHVIDAKTGQPIPDARVTILGPARVEMVTGPDGSFRSAKAYLMSERYDLEATRLGYATQRLTVDAANFGTVEFRLEPRALPSPVVEVTTTRAEERASAVAFSELDRPQVHERYWAQDVPMLLAELPGVYAYSDAGNGVGYSYVKIRGFPQRRVEVTINGIPLNDPESHEVYWVDHPDLVASAQSLQVQRGVGSALYGASAVGGSINLETLAGPGERSISPMVRRSPSARSASSS